MVRGGASFSQSLKRQLAVSALVCLAVGVYAPPPLARARADRLDESQVKAAFLYNFAKFVQWPTPDERSDALMIGVVGGDRFNEVLAAIVAGKSVNGRDIVVRQIQADDDVRAFHIVFIPASEARQTAEILQRVQRSGVLTVGETPQFLQEGGLIQFYVRDNHVRFQINAAAANQAGLKISSQLLSLSK